jgi:hypothetical protein
MHRASVLQAGKQADDMKLWLIHRIDLDSVDYEEYDSAVIRAEGETSAWEYVSNLEGFRVDNVEILELTQEGAPGIIISHFNP